jgi:hypothetical protein
MVLKVSSPGVDQPVGRNPAGGVRRRDRLQERDHLSARARKVLGWPKLCKLAHAFPWEYSYKRLKLAQLLGQLSVFLTTGGDAISNVCCAIDPRILKQGLL